MSKELYMNKTKIICTIGPASDKKEVFTELVNNGLSIARLNLSHGNQAYYTQTIAMIREVEETLNKPIGILLDTRGPEIRTMTFVDGKVTLTAGAFATLYYGEDVGTAESFCITYPDLYKDVTEGHLILLDDGLIELEVVEVINKKIKCVVKNGGILKNRKGINVPRVNISLPTLTEDDKSDIIFGIKQGIDYIAASFIRRKEDLESIRKLLDEHDGSDIKIISKIENQEGIDNIESIIEVSDAVMVARGDLGVEIPTELIPTKQKLIIAACNAAEVPVITATQMLVSMSSNTRPTRAEVSDVYNAVLDGTDAIMLSGETAAGLYPVESVKVMRKTADAAENTINYKRAFKRLSKMKHKSITNAVSYSACSTAMQLDASAIICPTFGGSTARLVSLFRPSTPIIAPTANKRVCRQMQLLWGVMPLILQMETSTDILFYKAIEAAKQIGVVKKDDLVVITTGIPLGTPGSTNLMRVHSVD